MIFHIDLTHIIIEDLFSPKEEVGGMVGCETPCEFKQVIPYETISDILTSFQGSEPLWLSLEDHCCLFGSVYRKIQPFIVARSCTMTIACLTNQSITIYERNSYMGEEIKFAGIQNQDCED